MQSDVREKDTERLARQPPQVNWNSTDAVDITTTVPAYGSQLPTGGLVESAAHGSDVFLVSGFNYVTPPNSSRSILSQDLGAISQPPHENLDFWSPSFSVDFSTYLDTVEHPTGPFSSVYQPLPFFQPAEVVANPNLHADPSSVGAIPARNVQLDDLHIPQSALTSRAPSTQPPVQARLGGACVDKTQVFDAHLKVDERCRDSIVTKLEPFRHVLHPNYKLPTKHTLNRFVYGWLTSFNNHYPMIHLPSLSLADTAVELFLAIASLGAQYCYEREKGRPLFEMSKSIALERLRGRSKSGGSPASQSARSAAAMLTQTAQALVLLIAISMWSQSDPSIRDALFLRSSLLALLQNGTLELTPGAFASLPGDWNAWIEYESAKRTRLIAFCFLNLFTIAFDMPPMLLYRDMRLVMPCDERTWISRDPEALNELMTGTSDEVFVTDVLDVLLAAGHVSDYQLEHCTSLGNYILIHAIIQHIWILHQTGNMATAISNSAVPPIEETLRAWQDFCWKHDQISSNDPTNPAGPLPFTSLALLRLAYIRVTTKSSFTGFLNIWEPDKIGCALYQAPQVQRSDKASRVALHCAQAIAIPIKTGLNFVAHTQVFYWSNQYALCSFECALLLSKWLEAVTMRELSPPRTPKEEKVLDFILQLMAETEYDVSRDELLRGRTLSILVVRLWSRLFRRDHVWDLVSIIGMSLEAYADNIERQNRG